MVHTYGCKTHTIKIHTCLWICGYENIIGECLEILNIFPVVREVVCHRDSMEFIEFRAFKVLHHLNENLTTSCYHTIVAMTIQLWTPYILCMKCMVKTSQILQTITGLAKGPTHAGINTEHLSQHNICIYQTQNHVISLKPRQASNRISSPASTYFTVNFSLFTNSQWQCVDK